MLNYALCGPEDCEVCQCFKDVNVKCIGETSEGSQAKTNALSVRWQQTAPVQEMFLQYLQETVSRPA